MEDGNKFFGPNGATARALWLALALVLVMMPCSSEVRAAQPDRPDSTAADRKATPASQPFADRVNRYRLCPGDVFDIAFPFTPEFNQSVTIQPDGYVSLNEIGNVDVAGKTVPELTELLRSSYGKILHDPVINISLKDFQKPYFIASGELTRPGKYELREDTTLTEAIAIAGGFTPDSKHSEVLVFRHESSGWVEIKSLDIKKMYKTADLREDLHLQPGDMVFVPKNRMSKFRRYIPSPGVGVNMAPY